MQQITDWLEKLDLGQYAQRFAENDINFAILPDLTDQDLKEIGVASLGHRRQLLRAITELKRDETDLNKIRLPPVGRGVRRLSGLVCSFWERLLDIRMLLALRYRV